MDQKQNQKINLTGKKEVFNFCEPYIIAEIASNHNGDMELAEKMILAAKEAGADCVKFQSWTKDTIFSKKVYEENKFLNDNYQNRNDFTLEEIVEKFSISEDQLLKMKNISDKIGIDCTSTPFSKKEIDFLVEKLNSPFIKIASMDVNNYPFLEYAAKKGKPIVLSTGLSEIGEIDKAVKTIRESGNGQLILLHCISLYPPKDEQINLNSIETLRETYGTPVGFSDHTLGTSMALAAVAKGACIIEKHFTLDKNLFGWDHKVSADKSELQTICLESKRIWRALGSGEILSQESKEQKEAFKRSIVASRNIKAGEIIREEDLDFKRPGTGLRPELYKSILGKTARRNIGYDELLTADDF